MPEKVTRQRSHTRRSLRPDASQRVHRGGRLRFLLFPAFRRVPRRSPAGGGGSGALGRPHGSLALMPRRLQNSAENLRVASQAQRAHPAPRHRFGNHAICPETPSGESARRELLTKAVF